MPCRRPALHDSDMYAIFRKSRTGAGQQARAVNLSRGGRHIQTTFADSTYGGHEAALFVARAYRDAVLEIVPPMTNRDIRMAQRPDRRGQRGGDRPRSDITGVTYAAETDKRSARLFAAIELADDTKPSGRRTFNVAELGHDAAKRAAEAERIRIVLAVENGEDPVLGSEAAGRLHKRLGKARKSKPAEGGEEPRA